MRDSLTERNTIIDNNNEAEDQIANRSQDLMKLWLHTALFYECLLEYHGIDAVLMIFSMDDGDPVKHSAKKENLRSSRRQDAAYLAKNQSKTTDCYHRKHERLSELTLLKEFDCVVVERLLAAWISGIRFLDTFSSPDDVSNSKVSEFAVQLCESIARIFSTLNRLGRESFNGIVMSSGLHQDFAAILLRYFCGNIHNRLLRSVNEDFKALLGVFFDIGE